MNKFRSKEDEVSKISTSIFVTNFPDTFTARDLFNSCKIYGHVVDSFIPDKKTKGGKRFGFVRFINVFNVDRLVDNLCTIWVGRLQLHANLARFQRPTVHGSQSRVFKDTKRDNYGSNTPNGFVGQTSGHKSFVNIVKGVKDSEAVDTPTVLLDDDCMNTKEVSLSLIGKVKEFTALSNINNAFLCEGFVDISIRYLGDLWVLLDFTNANTRDAFKGSLAITSWFSVLKQASRDFVADERIMWVDIEGVPFKFWSYNTFKKIASRWGVLLDSEDDEDTHFHSKRLCISTRTRHNVFETFKIVYKGSVFWIRAKEAPGWVPEFVDDSDDEIDSVVEIPVTDGDAPVNTVRGEPSDSEFVADTVFSESNGHHDTHSEDPFKLYDLLNKRNAQDMNKEKDDSDTREYPPGFTPKEIGKEQDQVDVSSTTPKEDLQGEDFTHNSQCNMKSNSVNSSCSGHFKVSTVPKTGGSILNCMEELVKVGQTMGYAMEGVENDIMKIIEQQGEEAVFR
ncbi:nucleotide-binding alpha-beta plait domain-containing protein [Tanacetum coccineum]